MALGLPNWLGGRKTVFTGYPADNHHSHFTAAQTNQEIIAAPGANKLLGVTALCITNGNAAPDDVTIKSDTTTVWRGEVPANGNIPYSGGHGLLFKGLLNKNLNITTTTVGPIDVNLSYVAIEGVQ